MSSNVIHRGLVSSLYLDGLTFSQNVPSWSFFQVRIGLMLQRPLLASKKVRRAGIKMEPPASMEVVL
jgi:hypothetical protein